MALYTRRVCGRELIAENWSSSESEVKGMARCGCREESLVCDLQAITVLKTFLKTVIAFAGPHTNCDSSLQPTAFSRASYRSFTQTHCSSTLCNRIFSYPWTLLEHIVATWLVELSRGNVVPEPNCECLKVKASFCLPPALIPSPRTHHHFILLWG